MRGRNFTDFIDLSVDECCFVCSGVLLIQKMCQLLWRRERVPPHTGVHCTGKMAHWRCVWGGRGAHQSVGGDGCEGTIISCVLSCVCADLSDPTIQIGVFCEELFICSQNTNG